MNVCRDYGGSRGEQKRSEKCVVSLAEILMAGVVTGAMQHTSKQFHICIMEEVQTTF